MAKPTLNEIADGAIARNGYQGILDQDGWETLELTVRAAYPKALADAIITRLGG